MSVSPGDVILSVTLPIKKSEWMYLKLNAVMRYILIAIQWTAVALYSKIKVWNLSADVLFSSYL